MSEEKKEEDEGFKKFMEAQAQEIRVHKWIESEKANRDLGVEAEIDWTKRFAEDFRKGWEKEHGTVM